MDVPNVQMTRLFCYPLRSWSTGTWSARLFLTLSMVLFLLLCIVALSSCHAKELSAQE